MIRKANKYFNKCRINHFKSKYSKDTRPSREEHNTPCSWILLFLLLILWVGVI